MVGMKRQTRLWESRGEAPGDDLRNTRSDIRIVAQPAQLDVSPNKKRPPISPAWIDPGLVTGGARSRNHKKTHRRCDTLPAHLLDRSQMYAKLKKANRFHRVV